MVYTLLIGVLTLEGLSEGQTCDACPLGQGEIDKLAVNSYLSAYNQRSTRQDAVMESDYVS